MLTHDEFCRQAIETVKQVDKDAVIAAWLGSLSTRNLPARSSFGSYVVLQHFKLHEFQKSEHFSRRCAYCGLPSEFDNSGRLERIENYPFQVQHTDLQYVVFDLATFYMRGVDAPTQTDSDLLKTVLKNIRALPVSAQLSELNKSLQGVLKSNKFERMILLETLGYAGILCPSHQKNYTDDFVTYEFANLQQPAQYYKREWSYPVRFWTGLDGVDETMVTHYFGSCV
jgi:hypothetical protein